MLHLVLSAVVAATDPAVAPAVPTVDPVVETMTRMRLWSAFLTDVHRARATYPLDDLQIHPLSEALRAVGRPPQGIATSDAWGNELRYRAGNHTHQILSVGSDGRFDREPTLYPLVASALLRIEDAATPAADLVLTNGRFIRRPFGGASAGFATVNAVNAVLQASLSYAVDNNQLPGESNTFAPIRELEPALVPVYLQTLPRVDGLDRPLLYARVGNAFLLASFGADGRPDSDYLAVLPCPAGYAPKGPNVSDDDDVVQACGEFLRWPKGTEP
jgi:hypothetical protein